MIVYPNRRALSCVLASLAFWAWSAGAQTVTRDKPYVPKFVRVEKSAEVLDGEACRPEYPKESARNEEEGTATVAATIASNGQFLSSIILKSSGFRALDYAAVTASARCMFRPGTIDGKPVQSIIARAFEWKME